MKNRGHHEQDQRFLHGLISQDPQALQAAYQRFYPGIAQHVQAKGGRAEDAEDVFQEAMVVVFRKLQDPDFELTCSLGTFLFGVSKKIWLNQASRRGRHPVQPLDDLEVAQAADIDTELERTERNRLFRAKLKQLGADCQKVLRLFFAGTPMTEIAQQMGYASESYAKKRKFQCKQKLTDLIKADPRYQEMRA